MKKLLSLILCISLICTILCSCGALHKITKPDTAQAHDSIRIGLAWRPDQDSIESTEFFIKAVTEAGGKVVFLDKVIDEDLSYDNGTIASDGITEVGYLTEEYADLVKKNKYANSNVKEIFEKADVDAVIFTGGEDVSPSLQAVATDWHHIPEEIDYNATRDVSDYLTMAFCIDNDIPILSICRGAQMLAVLSGGTLIQDIPAFFQEKGLTYHYEHRDDAHQDYAPHDVSITDKESIIYDIYRRDTVENVPSWHHQAVLSVENSPLKVTATTLTDGYPIIESIERVDKAFAIGIQFHPEGAIAKNLKHAENAGSYMTLDEANKIFQYLIRYVEEHASL